MYRKSWGVVGMVTVLVLSLALLAGCTPIPPEKVEQPQIAESEPTVEAYPTLTPAPASLPGCTNVRSVAFNMGAAVGTRICLEGIIDKITISAQYNRTTIEFDTSSGKIGGSLYMVAVIIDDSKAFGLDTLNQLVQGERIAVTGFFGTGYDPGYKAVFVLEVNKADDLIVLG